jgi:hypothetical protein
MFCQELQNIHISRFFHRSSGPFATEERVPSRSAGHVVFMKRVQTAVGREEWNALQLGVNSFITIPVCRHLSCPRDRQHGV